MKVVVVGLGSMGKRRIRLIQQYNPNLDITGVDMAAPRRRETEERYHMHTADHLDTVLAAGDVRCAFISTSPLSHAALIEKCLKNHVHVFTEINVVADRYDKNMRLAEQNGLVLFLSSTLLYREEIRHMRSILPKKRE